MLNNLWIVALVNMLGKVSVLHFRGSDVPARLGLKAAALAWLLTAQAFETCRPGQSRQTRRLGFSPSHGPWG
jgi:hypothetical protein